MPKIATYKYLEKVLYKLGFVIVAQKGSHVQFSNGKLKITVPKHSNKEVVIGVFGEILTKINLTRDEFWNIHKK